MRFLITGCSGFVGSRLVESLARKKLGYIDTDFHKNFANMMKASVLKETR